jgi:hypothetical protein
MAAVTDDIEVDGPSDVGRRSMLWLTFGDAIPRSLVSIRGGNIAFELPRGEIAGLIASPDLLSEYPKLPELSFPTDKLPLFPAPRLGEARKEDALGASADEPIAVTDVVLGICD